ncbi:MAG TPA: SDR family oxidoreductase [Bryobacteraceae bacterium]|nr:SDR family oxidoreductase [Bryobacteraceae bacterium]
MASKKVVLVTGASSGLGLACAEHLARAGHRVFGASRRALASSLFEPVQMDVRDDSSVNSAIRQILDREKRIDAVINNAGIAIAGALEDTSVEDARAQFDVNFFGALRVCRAVLPGMRERRAGHVVNISSIAGLVAVPYQSLYSASKFALEGLTESLRLEVAGFGIRVVLIEPGDHCTELTANRRATAQSQTHAAYRVSFDRALSRMAADEQNGPRPAAVARLVARVLDNPSPRLRYTTGPIHERAAVWLKRMLPYEAIEKLMSNYYSRP